MTVDAFSQFSLGVSMILQRWTALNICIEQDLAGPSSALKRTELYESIISYFRDEGIKLTVDELENSLYWYFDETFNLDLEDDSSKDVAERLCEMYQEVCVDGKFDKVERLRELVTQDPGAAAFSSQANHAEAAEALQLSQSEAELVAEDRSRHPIVDDDGFTLVQRGRGKKH